MSEPLTHPMQTECCHHGGRVPQAVTLRAYEVYSRLYGPQEALMTGGCRGGFSIGELIAFLYAYAFPKEQWRARVEEAMNGLRVRR